MRVGGGIAHSLHLALVRFCRRGVHPLSGILVE